MHMLKISILLARGLFSSSDKESFEKAKNLLRNYDRFDPAWRILVSDLIRKVEDCAFNIDSENLEKLLNLFGEIVTYKMISFDQIKKEDILKGFLMLCKDPYTLQAFDTFSRSRGYLDSKDWESLCESLNLDSNLERRFNFKDLSWYNLKDVQVFSKYKDRVKLDIQKKIFYDFLSRGIPIKGGLSSFYLKGSLYEKTKSLHWMVRLYHVSLGYSGNSINVKTCHWLLNRSLEHLHLFLREGPSNVGKYCNNPEIASVLRLLLIHSHKIENLHETSNGQVKIVSHILNLQPLKDPFNKKLVILETADFKLIPVISSLDKIKNLKKIIYVYPKT